MKDHSPPAWINKILRWYCKPDLLEDLEGDLHEYYLRHLKKSRRTADLIYFIDVIKFFRPYTVKKPEIMNAFQAFAMSGNFIKTSFRNLGKNKLFSSINILGLSVSMAIGLLMITFVYELLNYDNFQENSDRMYRIISNYSSANDSPTDVATTSVLIGRKLQESMPGIEQLVILRSTLSGDAKKGANVVPLQGFYASESFFDLFSFRVLEGNPATALREPNSIVLTEPLAKKLFEDNPIGQIVEFNDDEQYLVTAVVEDQPFNSHIRFEALVSLSTLENQALSDETSRLFNWSRIWNNYVYLRLKEDQSTEFLLNEMAAIAKEENNKLKNVEIQLDLQSFNNIIPGRNLSNQMGPNIPYVIIFFIVGLTMIVLLSACFNYTNLSIVKSMKRAKEIGIRKVMGASRIQVFLQFILEAIVTSLIALMIAIALLYWFKPYFLTLGDGDLANVVSLNIPSILYLYFLGFAVLVGILAGFIPSVFMSKMQTLLVLKDASKIKLLRGVNFRRVLTVLQFAISLVFMIACIGIYKQYRYALKFDLGYSTENIINVELEGNDPDVLRSEFKKLSGVEMVSRSVLVSSTGNNYNLYGKYKDPLDSARIAYNGIDESYIPIHKIQLLSGDNFRPGSQAVEESAIVNEEFLKRFDMGTAQEALNQTIYLEENPYRITAVARNFHHSTLSSPIRPFVFLYRPSEWRYLNVKVGRASTDILKKLEATWRQNDQVHSFNGVLYDEKIRQAYGEFAALAKIIGFLAFLAITIAVLGLLGMAVYTTESRLKEISIRKILGATEIKLMFLLSKGYIILLLISAIIAIPLSILWLNQLFASMIYKAGSNILEVFVGIIFILGIGLAIIMGRTLIAARKNPAEILKYE